MKRDLTPAEAVVAEFTLDTSGYVTLIVGANNVPTQYQWRSLAPFTQGYVEALFASVLADVFVYRGADRWPVGFSDLAPSTLAAILKDCAEVLASKLWGNSVGDGALFWTERQSKFDAFEGDTEVHLRTAWPPLSPTLGDDGKVYLRVAA